MPCLSGHDLATRSAIALAIPEHENDVTADAERFLMITRGQSGATQVQLNVVLDWFEELTGRVPVN